MIARVNRHPAAWTSELPGVRLLLFDQRYVSLHLHAGTHDGGRHGWVFGDRVTPAERPGLIAAVNGGFKLTYTDVGFMANGRVAVPLKPGLASIVTYADGSTDIGAWRDGVPTRTRAVYSVLQNQRLLIDRGAAAANLTTCVIRCWGGTIQWLTSVARSGLGITAGRRLVWAAGEELSPAQLADVLIAAGAVRAVELDINPWWVNGYVYAHRGTRLTPTAVVPGQHGIRGELLTPDTRDFLTFVAH